MDPLIITAACGQAKPPRANATPDSVEDVVELIGECGDGRSAVAQIRAPSKPDPVTGRPRADLERWKAMVSGIRDACDILIHTGTAAMEVDHRIEMIETVRPDMASFLLGHHGIVVRGHEHASLRTRADSLKMVKGHLAAGIKPDFEIFHTGHVRNLEFRLGKVALPKPLAITLFFGWDGGDWSPPTVEELLHRVEMLPEEAVWSITTTGVEQTIMHALAIARGGHVRAGLGDYSYYNEGVLGKGSGEFVARVVRLADELNRPVATPAEAARILGVSRN